MKRFSQLSICLFLAVVAAPAALPAQTITFAQPKQISVDATTGQLVTNPVAGDFNGDGNADFLVDVSGQLKVLLGDGAGNFSVVNFTAPPAGFDSYTVADVNGDGKDDIITLLGACDPANHNCVTPIPGAFTVFLNDGNGHFTQGYTSVLPVGGAYDSVVGDFNKDGKPDVAVLISPPAYNTNISNSTLVVFLNQGGGSFTPSYYPDFDLDIGSASNLVTGDFNGDGNPDLAVLDGYNNNVVLTFAGNGKGVFAAPQLSYSFDSGAQSMQAGDLTGSPKTDLVVSLEALNAPGANPRIATLVPKYGGGFYWLSAISTPFPGLYPIFNPFSISLSDLNGDGRLDLIGIQFEDYTSNTAPYDVGKVYPGLGNGKYGNGQFGSPTSLNLLSLDKSDNPYGLAVAVAPLKRGELPSLMLSNGSPTLELLVNTTKKP